MLELPILEKKLLSAWSRETSYLPDEWSTENPARWQCAVTAIVVQELFGGDILKCNVSGEGSSHFYNIVRNGELVDFTRSQFNEDSIFSADKIVTLESIFSHPDTVLRYKKLKGLLF